MCFSRCGPFFGLISYFQLFVFYAFCYFLDFVGFATYIARCFAVGRQFWYLHRAMFCGHTYILPFHLLRFTNVMHDSAITRPYFTTSVPIWSTLCRVHIPFHGVPSPSMSRTLLFHMVDTSLRFWGFANPLVV